MYVQMLTRAFVATNLEFTDMVIFHYACQIVVGDSNSFVNP